MKGPYERLKYDLRRLWECPLCHRRERTEGSVTYCLCSCASKGGSPPTPMKLLEEAGHRTVPSIVPLISQDEPAGPEQPAATEEPAALPDQPQPEIP